MVDEWRWLKIDDVKAQTEAAVAIGPFGSRMKSDRYTSSGIPVIRGNNISETRAFIGDFVYVSLETANELRSSTVVPGDLFFPHRGLIGEVGIVPSNGSEKYMLSSSLMKLTCNKDVVDPVFLFYFFRSPQGRHELLRYASTVGTPGIGQPLNSLRSIIVPVPPIPEQHNIATALSEVDALLQSIGNMIAKKRAIKLGAMQQLLFGRTRLPRFSEEWKEFTLGELADVKNGATPSTAISQYWDGNIPWCTPTDITATPGKYLSKTERTITDAGLESCGTCLLPAGTLLLCSRATIGEVKIATTEICTNQGFKSLVCKPGNSNEFLYYLVLTLKSKMTQLAFGTTFLEIQKPDVEGIQVKVPRIDEQQAIAKILSDIDLEIDSIILRRDKCKALKLGMMQSLLTGKVRLQQEVNA